MVVTSALSYFVPIFAFLLIFVVLFALIKKTGVLGDSDGIALLISFIIAVFFVLEASLIEIVRFGSSWISVLVIGIFFLIAIIGFLPGEKPLEFLSKGKWFSWVVLALIVGIFIYASVYTFDTAINWTSASDWVNSDWFGAALLIVIGIIAFFVITRKAK